VAQLIHSPANVIADNIPYRMEESKHMTNPTMPPPHVLEALRKPTYLEEHPSNPVEEPCCQTWETAHLIGTDCEMISSYLAGLAHHWHGSAAGAVLPVVWTPQDQETKAAPKGGSARGLMMIGMKWWTCW
jgi:hypothetical protein